MQEDIEVIKFLNYHVYLKLIYSFMNFSMECYDGWKMKLSLHGSTNRDRYFQYNLF